MSNNTFQAIDNHIAELFQLNDDAVQAADANSEAAGLTWLRISPVQGKFLNVMASACRAQRILEIGTCAGYSGIWLARALPENGRLITLELEPEYAALARKNFELAGLTSRVEVRVGDALESLKAMVEASEAPFDMVFIDADKPPYPEYLKWALKLSKSGTFIVADNVIRYARINEEVQEGDELLDRTLAIRQFAQDVASNEGLNATFLQMVGEKEADGMALMVVQ